MLSSAERLLLARSPKAEASRASFPWEPEGGTQVAMNLLRPNQRSVQRVQRAPWLPWLLVVITVILFVNVFVADGWWRVLLAIATAVEAVGAWQMFEARKMARRRGDVQKS